MIPGHFKPTSYSIQIDMYIGWAYSHLHVAYTLVAKAIHDKDRRFWLTAQPQIKKRDE